MRNWQENLLMRFKFSDFYGDLRGKNDRDKIEQYSNHYTFQHSLSSYRLTPYRAVSS